MASFAQIPTLVYTAVLGLDSPSAGELARIAFGTLLWIVLVTLNGTAADASPAVGTRRQGRPESASPSRAPGADA